LKTLRDGRAAFTTNALAARVRASRVKARDCMSEATVSNISELSERLEALKERL
jgi:hypothetical protein